MTNDFETKNTAGEAANGNTLSNEDVIECLNDLIETSRDGQAGFREAAEAVESSEAKSLFVEYSQQRAQFVGELQTLVRELGGEDVIVIRHMVYLSITYDHRVIDGALATQCLAAMCKSLEAMNESNVSF